MGELSDHLRAGGELILQPYEGEREFRVAATPAWPTLNNVALRGLAGQLVEALDPHTEADPVAVLLQFLVAFGNAVGRRPHFRIEGDFHHTNLFAVVVGSTAKGRKGTSWGRTRQILEAADSAWVQARIVSGLSSGEGLIWAVHDDVPAFNAETGEQEIVDPGIADKRLLVQESELASTLRTLRRDGSTLSAVIRNAWDTGSLRTLTKNNPSSATDAHISIIGHITKEELRRYLDATEMANGFANRFLWVCVRRSKCLPEGGQLSDATLFSLSSQVRNALEVAKRIGHMTRSPAARALWASEYAALSDGRPGLLGAVTSRAEAQVTRLSCLYALLAGRAVIEVEDLEAALALWAYCEESCRYIFGDTLGDPIADTISAELKQRPDGLTKSDISNVLGRHARVATIDRALAFLQECGLAELVVVPTGGRPIHRWVATAKKAKEAKKGGEAP